MVRAARSFLSTPRCFHDFERADIISGCFTVKTRVVVLGSVFFVHYFVPLSFRSHHFWPREFSSPPVIRQRCENKPVGASWGSCFRRGPWNYGTG